MSLPTKLINLLPLHTALPLCVTAGVFLFAWYIVGVNIERTIHTFCGHPKSKCVPVEPLAVQCSCGEVIRLSDFY